MCEMTGNACVLFSIVENLFTTRFLEDWEESRKVQNVKQVGHSVSGTMGLFFFKLTLGLSCHDSIVVKGAGSDLHHSEELCLHYSPPGIDTVYTDRRSFSDSI